MADLTAGLLSALVTLCYAVGYGSMMFSGSLARYLVNGMPAILISCAVVMLVVSMTSSIRFSIGGPESNVIAILVGVTTGVATDIKAHGGASPVILATVLATIALSSIVTGVLLYALGASRRSTVIQFLPFPVIGGFLAGTGYLILSGAFRMLTGDSLHWSTLGRLAALRWVEWLPSVVVCATLLVVSRRLRSVALLPIGLTAGLVVFYFGLDIAGISIDDARHAGLLFTPEPLSALQLPAMLPGASIDWPVIVRHLPEFLVIAVVAAIAILLNVTGIGLATGEDTDFNRELRAAGIANVVTAAFGGVVGYQSLSRSLLNRRAGANSRAGGIAGALACLALIGLFPGVLAWFPKPVMVGLQLYLAVGLLNEWLIGAYRKLGRAEYLLILLILVVIVAQGVVAGVLLGIVAACVLFVVNYSRVSVVRSEFDGGGRHSNVERSIDDVQLLNDHAAHVVGTCLQGFLFFGTSNSVLRRVRERLDAAHTPRPRFVVVDFRQVDGLDASTSLTFRKLKQYCEATDVTLVLTALPAREREMLARAGVLSDTVKAFDDIDAGLEWTESSLLAALKPPLQAGEPNLRSELKAHFSPEALRKLSARLDQQILAAGELLFAQGAPGNSVYIVERGRVTVSLPLAGGKAIRLRSFGGGTIVGEMALYTQKPRSADVRADEPTVVRRLSLDALRQLEDEEPEVAREFHRFVVNVLASRLAVANETVRTAH
ncbi:SLC26A/SulP transporter family protein [Burkholderia sp. lig30]|uniref:SLC26A/SulP transporter family protein n=1 Tax=Burkholderia sp. lig30 TaxID=1192124 RepID=UPI001EECE689|nr:SulP family inorganic anion transporter [Burkholderia sp. lig30]